MSCLISAGKLLGCKDQRGGYKNLYFANYDDYSFVIAAHEVTSLGSLDEVFKYEVKAEALNGQSHVFSNSDFDFSDPIANLFQDQQAS